MIPDLKGMFVAMAIVCIVIGVALAYAIPWLWDVLKPLLHAMTT